MAISGKLPEGWDKELPTYEVGSKGASRDTSGQAINAIAKAVPQFFGGSADLASSNKTAMKDQGYFSSTDYSGRNIWFGVREFAMGAALNGLALHGGVKVFGGTFFVFSDYLRPAIRLAALMGLPVTYVFTSPDWSRSTRQLPSSPCEHHREAVWPISKRPGSAPMKLATHSS